MRTYVQPLPSIAKTKSEKEKEPAVLFFTTRWCCSALKILSSYKAWKNPSRSSWGTTEDQRLLPVTHVLDFTLLDNSVHVTIKIIILEKCLTNMSFNLQHSVQILPCPIYRLQMYVLGHAQKLVKLTEVKQEHIESHKIALKYYTKDLGSV